MPNLASPGNADLGKLWARANQYGEMGALEMMPGDENQFRLCDILRFQYGPDWRWRYARQLYDESADLDAELDDPWLSAAMDYYHDRLPLKDLIQLEEVCDLNCEQKAKRTELQGRVLANQCTAAIAAAMDIPTARIELFEKCFFDVRPRLDARDYIVFDVIEWCCDGSPLLRVQLRDAYLWGPLALQHCLDHLPYLGQAHDLGTEEGRVRELLEIRAQTEQVISQGQLAGDRFIRLYLELQQFNSRKRRLTVSEVFKSRVDGYRAVLMTTLAEARKRAKRAKQSSDRKVSA